MAIYSIFETLQQLDIPVAYSHFKEDQAPPYVVYIGNGQDQYMADDGVYKKSNVYQVEYYFTKKNEALEDEIEQTLTEALFVYEKSADTWLEDEEVFVIYYDVARKGFYNA
jgi:hypothetical protein